MTVLERVAPFRAAGRLVFWLFSVKTTLTAVAFCVSGWRAWHSLQERLRWNRDMPSDDLPLRLLNLQFAVYQLSFFCMALLILESGREAKYAARWNEFQVRSLKIIFLHSFFSILF